MNIVSSEKIAVVLTGDEKNKTLYSAIKKVGWVELRVDVFLKNFSENDLQKWVKKIRRKTKAKIIGTVRWHKESQNPEFVIPDKKRISLYQSIVNDVDFLDVELKSKIASDVIRIAKENRKNIILSYHNFQKTPSQKFIFSLYSQAKKSGANIFKIATVVRNKKDLMNLITLAYLSTKGIFVVAVPMGTGVLERIVPLAFGSIFTYVAIEKKTAPGQPFLTDLCKDLTKKNMQV